MYVMAGSSRGRWGDPETNPQTSCPAGLGLTGKTATLLGDQGLRTALHTQARL
jgi:hypothetical protein